MAKNKLYPYTAEQIAEAINCWAGKEHRREIITPEEVRSRLTPIATHEEGGYLIYAYQWGDVTILIWVQDGEVRSVQHVTW